MKTDLTISAAPEDFNQHFVQGQVKTAITEAGAKTRDLLMVPIDKLIVVEGLNVRIRDEEYEAHVVEIMESILEHGFYQHFPLSAFAGKEGDGTFVFVTGGFTRLLAAKRAIAKGASIEALPVVLKPPGTSMADLNYALDIDNTGSPLKPYERAIVLKRAIGFGEDVETAARKMNIGPQYATDLLYMMGLPTELKAQVLTGRTSAANLIQLTRKLGSEEALKTFQEAGDTGVRRVTERTTGVGRAQPIIAKKTLFSAIDYAIALPSEGIKWLSSWRKQEPETVAELAAYKPPRKPRADKGTGKAAAKKAKKKGAGKGTSAPKPDPMFDTGTGSTNESEPL